MKTNILIGTIALLAASLNAADSSAKNEAVSAAKKLGEKSNYSWKQTVVAPEGSRFRPGPTEGKIEKDGFTHITSSFGDNTTQTILKGDKAAVTSQEDGWQSIAELEGQEQGFGRFRAAMARNFKAPAVQAADIAAATKDLKKEGDAYSGDLTEAGAKALMSFGGRGGGGANVSNAKGSAKFWVKDGVLSKYEYKLKGTITVNNNDVEIDRTTTVEIKDVGTTKIDVPEAAKKKLT